MSALEAPWTGADRLFASQRVDDQVIASASFEHCTFVNVSFKDCELTNSTFVDCIFINCYFRKTRVHQSSFVGCRFMDCQFPKIQLSGCDFRYSRFDRCIVDAGEMKMNLPAEHNLREELAHQLAVAAESIGRTRQARRFRLQAIGAREAHLVAAVRGENSWYREKFSTLQQIGAATRWMGSRANGLLWGYGERWTALGRNLLIATFVVYPLLFWMAEGGLAKAGSEPNIGDFIALSVDSVLPMSDLATVELTSWVTRLVVGLEAFTGLVAAGLFVTILFRSVTHR